MRTDLLIRDKRRTRRRTLVAAAASLPVIALAAMTLRFERPRGDVRPSPDAATAALPKPSLPGDGPDASDGAAKAATGRASDSGVSGVPKSRPIAAWLSDVARDAGSDLVLSPEVRGELTASEASRLDWRERLASYSRVFGFEFEVTDGLIEVWRAEKEIAERRAAGAAEAAPAAEAAALRAGENTSGQSTAAKAADSAAAAPPKPISTKVLRLAHAPAKETAAVLSKAGDKLDVTVTADAAINALVLSGEPASIQRVLGVASELDRPLRRILLEAKIVEIARSARLDLGIEWKLTGKDAAGEVDFPPNISDAGKAALTIATGGIPALDARITALEAGGKLRVVSRPSVVMLEGSPATIESVRILRIRLPSQGDVVGEDVVQAPSSRATEDIPVGVRLEVTPAIRSGGHILLRIKAKSSNLGAPLPPDNIPEELSRMVDAEVLVADGETAVLGGLTREVDEKSGAGVPGLRRIPGLGALFGRNGKSDQGEELVVLVTPTVLD